jgi:hypothetical protein
MICKVHKKHERTRFAEIESRDRSIYWQGRLPRETDALFDEHGLTFFADCEVHVGRLKIIAVVEPRAW